MSAISIARSRLCFPQSGQFDAELSASIRKYVNESEKIVQQIDPRSLKDELKETGFMLLWGAGQWTMKLLQLPWLQQVKVSVLMDTNCALRGKMLNGSPITRPSALGEYQERIVTAILLHQDEIISQIRQLGLRNPIVRSSREAGTGEKSS